MSLIVDNDGAMMEIDDGSSSQEASLDTPLRFNQLLTSAGIDPIATRLLRHQTRLADGRSPIDLWRTDPALLFAYQSYQRTEQRSWFRGRWWAAFVGTADGRTLFVGLFEVGVPMPIEGSTAHLPPWLNAQADRDDHYPLRPVNALAEYAGRLYVDWGGGSSGKRSWRQRADAQDKTITELHLDVAAQPFPGLLALAERLSTLSAAPPLWIAQLRAARGVYLLTCPTTGELYIGAATGAEGFWGRWLAYAANGHGGNVAMRTRERTDWVVSVLQVAGSADSDDDVIAMEGLWKRKLQSRMFGLNRNG